MSTNLDRWVAWRLGAILLGSALVGLVLSLLVIRDRFHALEAWLVEQQLHRVERVLGQEMQEMERLAADYAQWDDTLAYMQSKDAGFVTANFPRETGENLNTDGVILWDAEGYERLAIDFVGEADFQPLAAELVDGVRGAVPPFPDDGRVRRDAMLAFVGGHAAVIGRASVTDSAEKAPANGSLAFVRVLDAADLARLEGLAGVRFVIESGQGLVGNSVRRRADGGWQGRKALERGLGIDVQVEVPALLGSQWRITAAALALMTVLNLLVCVVWVRHALRRKVTGRLGRFVAISRGREAGGVAPERWPVEGEDDIDQLGRALNTLVDDLERQQAVLDRMAYEDMVTGLPNRRRLLEWLSERLAKPVAEGAPPSVLVYIDLVGFKPINDALGHAVGDAVLRTFAERLCALPPPLARVVRVGGDEFGLLLDGVPLADAAAWFAGVVDGLVAEVDVGGQRLRFDLIAGLAERPGEGDASAWLSMADIAMYAARRERRGRIGLYTDDLRAAVHARHVIGKQLFSAIDHRTIEAWFQPVVNLRDGRLLGFEALARWRLDGAWVPPMQFIPVAEEEGLIGPLTTLMLEQVCDLLAGLSAVGRGDLVCSLNVSPVQVADHRLPEQLMAIVEARGADPRRIAIEVTEEAIQSRPEWVAETFRAIRACGFRLWLDDFGIGHASFARLRDYAFDVLKIDRSFTMARQETRAANLLEGIIHFGQRIGLAVTAEGVETEDDRRALEAMGCDHAQGYHFGRPMPASEAISLAMASVASRRDDGV